MTGREEKTGNGITICWRHQVDNTVVSSSRSKLRADEVSGQYVFYNFKGTAIIFPIPHH
jgi:hypothetical protein